jgi:adhesin HecA-like repeat protein
MNVLLKRFGSLAILSALLSACSTFGTTTTVPVTTTSSNATLQLAVGTLNNTSGLLGSPGTYLNAVTTFRNSTGTAAYFHPGTAALTGPGSLNASLGELFAYGQPAGANGTLGEPPAFAPQNSIGGYSTGYILTGAPPTGGTYTVATTVQTNGKNLNFSATATLPNAAAVLPPEPLPTWTTDGKGGGTFTMTNPAGVTESLIFVQAGNGAYVADVELKSPATSVNVPDGTLGVGVTYYVFCLGADYPMIEDAPPNSHVARPALAGASGTADLTASSFTTFTE